VLSVIGTVRLLKAVCQNAFPVKRGKTRDSIMKNGHSNVMKDMLSMAGVRKEV